MPSASRHPRSFAQASLLILCVLMLLSHASTLHAHAILVRSTPAVRATLSGDSVDFSLHFNSRIDAPRSLLILVLPDGKTEPLKVLKTDSLETLGAHTDHLPDGAYTLRWQVLANDGHISRGEIPFTVRNGK